VRCRRDSFRRFNTVTDELKRQKITGTPDMTPSAIKESVEKAGLKNITLPTCDVAEQARTMAADKNIDVQLRVDADPLPVRADEASLRRLLLILVDNAVKFTPRGGAVIVAGGRDATHVTLSVADTGAGIASDDQRHIFERFWRADKVRGREAGGTGLGLPIARQIAEQHGAGLSVESEVGGGSLFAVRLPAAVVQSPDTPVVMSSAGMA